MSRGSQRPSYFPQGHTSPRIPLILPSSENFSSACSSRSTRMQTRFLGPSRYQADTCLKLHQLNYLFGIFPRLENALISKTSVPWMGWGTQSPNVILGNCSSDRVGMHRLSETGGVGNASCRDWCAPDTVLTPSMAQPWWALASWPNTIVG